MERDRSSDAYVRDATNTKELAWHQLVRAVGRDVLLRVASLHCATTSVGTEDLHFGAHRGQMHLIEEPSRSLENVHKRKRGEESQSTRARAREPEHESQSTRARAREPEH